MLIFQTVSNFLSYCFTLDKWVIPMVNFQIFGKKLLIYKILAKVI